ncbi:MAG: MFS transporter [Cyclobacteriaceae bacterium]|nr:MFS transporter [Cyclobacteriaceae bacterium]
MKKSSPWAWVPSLYLAEGLPYVVVMTVSVIMYKRLGISNTDIALYTSWLYLPWVIKPFWSPLVDLLKTKRWWIIIMQLFIGAGLAGIAFTIPAPSFFQYTLAFFWLLAFSSATHDIAADGFYMLGLSQHDQALFVGIRSTFYRIAMITGQGLLIILAGALESGTGMPPVQIVVKVDPAMKSGLPQLNDSAYSSTDGPLQFVLTSENLVISTEKISSADASEIKLAAKASNEKNGLIPMELSAKQAGNPSWWTTNISAPLKEWLMLHFGKEKTASIPAGQTVGNIGIIGLHLSAPPNEDEQVVLNVRWDSGDKNISLVHGERLVFTDKNWNHNAWMVFQADAKLDQMATTSFEGLSGNITLAWSVTFYVMAALFVLFFLYHRFILPRPDSDKPVSEGGNMIREFVRTFKSFFQKDNLGPALFFFLMFRFAESQLVKLASLFLLDSRQNDGLGLTTSDVGLIYGTIGIVALTIGGILGGFLASRKGLKYWIWWMTLAINLPNLVYVYLSIVMPSSFVIIASCVAIEQFGYGFGFTAYMLFMIHFAEGKSKTAHYAIITGFMALGMMLPGMYSGWLQEIIGYKNFFIWVMICTIPGFLIVRYLKINPAFGIKKD